DQRDRHRADGKQPARRLLQEQAEVDDAAVATAVLLGDRDADPAQLGDPPVDLGVVALLVRVALLAGPAFARREVAHRLHERALPALQGGGRLRLADYRGKVVVLNFWASWCAPCTAEAPLLERTQRQLGSQGTVLGATYNDVPGDSLGFARKEHLTYPSGRDV